MKLFGIGRFFQNPPYLGGRGAGGLAKIGYAVCTVPPKTQAAPPSPTPEAFWHAAPLHYVPYLLHTGALYSQTRLLDLHLPIIPRPTAARRDKKLRLDNFVHFSFAPHTPLLSDKHKRGYPHVLMEFPAQIADLPGAGFVPYNAKAWRHRDAFVPITTANEKAAFLQERARTGRFPSAELVIPGELALAPHGATLHAETPDAAKWVCEIVQTLRPAFVPTVFASPHTFPGACAVFDWEPFQRYAHSLTSWRILADAIGEMACSLPSPPNLPFD